MTEQLQTDYLDIYKGIYAEIHQVSQFDEPSFARTFSGKANMKRKDAFETQKQFSIED